MNRAEAISILNDVRNVSAAHVSKAIDLAEEALREQEARQKQMQKYAVFNNAYDIPDAMKAARKRQKLYQHELAEASGVSDRNIQNYECGKNVPNALNLIALADALNISIDEYIGRVVITEHTKEDE